MFKLTPPERPFRERGASDADAHTRRLPCDPGLARNRLRGGDDAAGDQALSAGIFAREHEDGVTGGDLLAAIHRLVRGEGEGPRPRLTNLGFDRERHAFFSLVRTADPRVRRAFDKPPPEYA